MSTNSTTAGRVADAPSNSWVYRLLPVGLWPYAQLARWDRPIGWKLLLWPCMWSLALAWSVAGETIEPTLLAQIALFWAGAVAMRGAGCTYNDVVDVDIDAKVARTASRPIPSGRVSKMQATVFLVAQALAGLLVLLGLCALSEPFNGYAFILACSSLGVVAFYPFAKRLTDWPQFVLGLSFSWGALMGWAVVFGELSAPPVLLYIGSILWVIGYDTIYAHQDREDDAIVGVRSTARLFGDRTVQALLILYGGTLILFAAAYFEAGVGAAGYIGLLVGGMHMIWQITSLDIEDGEKCLRLFRSNNFFGWAVFAGLIANWLI
ncbi:4-hydroxybenzoate octaprenyltransferase [Ahrensia sp. R2A130]|uniref:4-hydroxybenzoate octaprenyltransferase n=1 Tax=Ahrensia sp. R2A130 TaxID=744979 RepID=UPI0001E0D101|nr:4-hydroxybenzoate octaprenyltransferase [Ahrensia sp. R2A130]EFL88846.1 4-hydroxybenzoate polyprenyl transferase [Ahrensia sp. R2A130]